MKSDIDKNKLKTKTVKKATNNDLNNKDVVDSVVIKKTRGRPKIIKDEIIEESKNDNILIEYGTFIIEI
jgi:hypothetical protein